VEVGVALLFFPGLDWDAIQRGACCSATLQSGVSIQDASLFYEYFRGPTLTLLSAKDMAQRYRRSSFLLDSLSLQADAETSTAPSSATTSLPTAFEFEEDKKPLSGPQRSTSNFGGKADKEKRKRSRVTPEQLVQLERYFAADRSPTAARRHEISELLGMQERQTQIWFQNRFVNSHPLVLPCH
jgi:hypothetical protein